MKPKTMQDLFEHLLHKAYDCEQKLVKKDYPEWWTQHRRRS